MCSSIDDDPFCCGDQLESGIGIKILERQRGTIRTAYDEKVQLLMVDDMKAI